MFKKKSVLTPEMDDKIFNDFLYFYDLERKLHRLNQDKSKESNDCVCENIALLDPISLNIPAGKERMDYWLGNKSPSYKTGHRICTFIATITVKYGSEVVKEYRQRCLDALLEYGTLPVVITNLDHKYNTFWTYVLFIRAYNNFMYAEVIK